MNEQEFLKRYDAKNYERPSLTVDTLIFTVLDKVRNSKNPVLDKELKILLIKRKRHPYKDCWAIPGGFVNMEEDIEAAAYRELKEETNVDNVYLEQLYTFGKVDRDPRTRVISIAYMALCANANSKLKAGDDAKEAKWFIIYRDDDSIRFESEDGVDSICYRQTQQGYSLASDDSHALAFDHLDMILLALDRMKNKIEYTAIAFTLLPEKFTLSEAHKLYEAILGKSLDFANFRRDMLKQVERTDEVAAYNKRLTLYRYHPGKN